MAYLGIGEWILIALPFAVPAVALLLNYIDEKYNEGYISIGGGR